MGRVYKARDPLLERVVALKFILLKHVAEDARKEFKERFFREARIGASLHHPNIVSIYDLGEFRGRPYMVMEYVEGDPLDSYLKINEPLDQMTLLALLDQMAEGLDAAHRRGIIHRDIKPGNMIVTKRDKVKILDFGMARMADSKMTKTGEFLGTPRYASPEQVAGKPVDHRADLFSLAVVAHEMLTGASPFPGESISAILFRIAQGNAEIAAPPPELEADEVKVQTLFQKALHLEPEARFQSAEELVDQLRLALTGAPEIPPTIALPPAEVEAARTGTVRETMTYPISFWERDAEKKASAHPEPEQTPGDEPSDEPETVPAGIPLQDGNDETTVSDSSFPLPEPTAASRDVDIPEEPSPFTTSENLLDPAEPKQGMPLPKVAMIAGGTLVALVILVLIIGLAGGGGDDGDQTLLSVWAEAAASGDPEKMETALRGLRDAGLAEADHEAALAAAREIRSEIENARRDLDLALDAGRIEEARRLADLLRDRGENVSQVRDRIDALVEEQRAGEARDAFLKAYQANDSEAARAALDELSALGVDITAEERRLAKLEEARAAPKPKATPIQRAPSRFDRLTARLEEQLEKKRVNQARGTLEQLEELSRLSSDQRNEITALRRRIEVAELGVRLNLEGLDLSESDLTVIRDESRGRKPSDLYILAKHYREGTAGKPKDPKRSLALLRLAADNHPRAALELASFFLFGTHVRQDSQTAITWAEHAAGMGSNQAWLFLGEVYYEGQFVSQDLGKAQESYLMAAQSGDPEGQFRVGQCYEKGRGVSQSATVAHQWYKLAADQGHERAQAALRDLKEK